MKNIIPFIAFFISLQLSAQVSGDIKDDNRNLLSTTDFTIQSNVKGEMYFKISVNIEGEVTTASLDREKSTVKSTPNMIKAKNMIMHFVFEKGTHYPKFHQGVVKIIFTEQD